MAIYTPNPTQSMLGYNPYPTMTQTGIPASSFVWVQGEAGAKAYPVAAGNRVALFDSENPVVYIKATDAYGKPAEMEVYDLVKRNIVEESPTEAVDFVKREEIESMVRSEVEKALAGISLKPASKKKKKGDDEE